MHASAFCSSVISPPPPSLPSYSLPMFQRTLMVLNVSGNGLDNLTELKCLAELTVLLAANNELDSLEVGSSVCLHGVLMLTHTC